MTRTGTRSLVSRRRLVARCQNWQRMRDGSAVSTCFEQFAHMLQFLVRVMNNYLSSIEQNDDFEKKKLEDSRDSDSTLLLIRSLFEYVALAGREVLQSGRLPRTSAN